jgi:hypothetical protein
MNNLSLVVMQLPAKHKENFDVSSEGLSSGVTDKAKALRLQGRNIRITAGGGGGG